MKYCKRCLYPENHPFGIVFDDDGICSGCLVHEEKKTLDWKKREKKLEKLLESYRSTSGLNFDCIVPVSGARDSYFIVDILKNRYGMNPLLVTYNKHYNTHVGNRNYAYLKTLFNCDALSLIVQPQKVKKITKVTLEKMGSIYWHILAGQTVFPVQVAVRFKIPLIVWGNHQGVEQVGMFSHADEAEMTRKYRKEYDLMGFEAEDLLVNSNLKETDITQYIYPQDREIEKVGVRGIYLGNYIPWDTKKQHEAMIKQFNYETFVQQRSFDTYSDIDCVHYNGLHDYIKYLKWGYSKVTDHASREIRWNRLSREEAIRLVKKYEQVQPADIKYFLNWLNITDKELFDLIDRFRDAKVWVKKNAKWERNDHISNHMKSDDPFLRKKQNNSKCDFVQTTPKDTTQKEDGYTLLEKGFVG